MRAGRRTHAELLSNLGNSRRLLMRIDVMRDVIKYSSLASCDSHSFSSEFHRRARRLGKPRRLSNITECLVQCFTDDFLMTDLPPRSASDWPTSDAISKHLVHGLADAF